MMVRRTAAVLLANTLRRTVEWNRSVAKVHSRLNNVSQFVLPELPSVITPDLEEQFFDATATPERRIQTIAIGLYENHRILQERIQEVAANVDTVLMVGGNTRNHISIYEAIQIARDTTQSNIWCVSNANRYEDTERLYKKINAGAMGVITQPLFSLDSWSTFEQHYSEMDATIVVGMAFPKSIKSILFWLDLLDQPELQDDALVKEHLDYVGKGKSSLDWVQREVDRVLETRRADGIHYMALDNTSDLLSILKL